MKILRFIIDTILDSLFPLSKIEKELLTMTREKALSDFKKSPKIEGEHLYSVFHYKDEYVSRLIWSIKYKKSKNSINIGAYALYEYIKEYFIQEKNLATKILLLPIPVSKRRRNERGYNQCEILLDEMKNIENINPNILFDYSLLERNVHIERQTMKNRKERLGDATDIFSVNKKALEKYSIDDMTNIQFIIIDDVITTGSTMNEARKTLIEAGFANVIGLSIAH